MLDTQGCLHTVDSEGLSNFVSEKEGALNVIEQLRGGVKSRWTYALIRKLIMALIQQPKNRVYQTYKIPAASDFTVYRARRLDSPDEWYACETDLGSPPADKTKKYGRCHQPEAPMFYSSLYADTALSEIDVELGDRIVISEFKIEQDIIAMPVGELDYYRRTKSTYLGNAVKDVAKPFDDALAAPNAVIAALIDAFLADEFIKPATSNTDYKITSAFSDIVLNEFEQNHKVDAIVYPSVAFRGGLNFAIQPESLKLKMKLISAEIIEITDVIGYGIFGRQQLGILKSVIDGQLNWTVI